MRRSPILLVALTVVLLAPLASRASDAAPPAPPKRIALRSARLIDGASDTVRRDAVVIVEGEKIAAVGGKELLTAGVETIDLGDATLLPGLIDCHSHPLITSDDYQVQH